MRHHTSLQRYPKTILLIAFTLSSFILLADCSFAFAVSSLTVTKQSTFVMPSCYHGTGSPMPSVPFYDGNKSCRRCCSRNSNTYVMRSMNFMPLFSDNYNGDVNNNDEGGDNNMNPWSKSLDPMFEEQQQQQDEEEDWQEVLKRRQDGSLWSSFEPTSNAENGNDNDDYAAASSSSGTTLTPSTYDDEGDAWLDTLASISAEEVQFNLKEAERADKVRQMQEWGFQAEQISAALGVATDDSLETKDETDAAMRSYEKQTYADYDVDLTAVESHAMVDVDEDTGEPVRSQMVYVDEHTCIGCTNCAMIAQSTFFMHPEHGRARVFQQWGDDDETIAIAIETCPVDCIHYVPYDELKKLEVERRDQNINFKARLVSQAEYGGVGLSHRVGGASVFTAPQKISGNMKARCNNCPSRGCYDCPMYGVGKNPEYERKEKARKEKLARKRMKEQMESNNKSAEL